MTSVAVAVNQDLKFTASSATDQGKREYQDDDFCIVSMPYDGLAICVADGLGGYKGGAIASKMAVEQFAQQIDNCHDKKMKKDWVCSVTDDLVAMGREKRDLSQASTTAIGCGLQGNKMSFVSVGDSLLLHARGKQIKQVNVLHESGYGGLTSFLGWGLDKMNFDEVELLPGDWVVAATDGIETISLPTHFVGQQWENVLDILNKSTPDDAAQKLVDFVLAQKNVHQDNVTVVAVKVLDA